MIRSLWIAKTGMEAQQTQLDVTSHNLANVSTTGFKKSRAVFEDLLYQNIRQPGGQSSQQTNLPSGMQQGTGVRPVAIERIHTQGNPQATGNDKDIMVNGAGFFNVLLPDGTTAYTRDGSFQRDNNGQMVTSSGFVLQPPITIPIEAQNITVGRTAVLEDRPEIAALVDGAAGRLDLHLLGRQRARGAWRIDDRRGRDVGAANRHGGDSKDEGGEFHGVFLTAATGGPASGPTW